MPACLPAMSKDKFKWPLPLFSIPSPRKGFSQATPLAGDAGGAGRLPRGRTGLCGHKISTLESSNKVEYLSV